MAVTRIKNNQITDSAITYQKISSGTLVGSLFNPNLTLNSNVSIVGNLTVSGNTTTVNSVDTVVSDPLITLNNGYVGTPSYDVGILFNRALGTLSGYGGVNAALIWSETEKAFVTVLTTETGSTAGSINKAYKANVSVGNLSVANAISAQSLTISTLNTSAFNTTSFTATGNIVAASGTVSGSVTSGAIVVPGGGGVGITGALYVGGASNFSGNMTAGNIYITGNINVPVGGVTSNTAVFYGQSNTGINALYAGVPGFTPVVNTIVQYAGNTSVYSEVNLENTWNGPSATADYVLTADDGTDSANYADFGITSSTYDGTLVSSFSNGLGTAASPRDTYLYAHGNQAAPTASGGNLLLGTAIPGKVIRVFAGGMNIADVVTTTTSSGFAVNIATPSTSTTTGALRVAGGVGIVGSLYVGGTLNAASAAFSSINNTPVGNATPSTGAFTTLSATTTTTTNFSTANAYVTGGYADNFPIGANTASTGRFTFSNATTIYGGTATIATVNSTTGNITGLTSTTINAGTVTVPQLNTTSGNATTLVATNFSSGNARISSGYADNFPIGANTAATGAFTTLGASGVVTFTNATQSASSGTGAVVVTGGVGVGANLNVGGNLIVSGNLTILGTTTTVNSTTLDVADLNITVAKGAATAAAANGAGLTVDGASATITYASSDDSWNLNKKLNSQAISATSVAATSATITTINSSTVTVPQLNTTSGNATTFVATNFSSGNARITGGYADNFPIGANTAAAGRFTFANATSIYGDAATIATVNSTTGNITALNSTTINASTTTSAILNSTTGNITGLTSTTISAGTTTSAQLNSTNGNITTLVATNLSSGNARITSGYADNFPIGANTASTGRFTFSNATTSYSDTSTVTNFNSTNGNITTLVATNLSSGNARITSGYADNFPIGANTRATGAFTTVSAATGSVGGLQAQAIGNVTPGTAAFTTLTTSGNVVAASGAASTTTNTGALVVVGGTGVSGNITVGQGATINSTQSVFDTVVRGVSEQSLLLVHASVYDQVSIGGNLVAANVQQGAKLQINSTDSLLLPVGTSAQRPSSVGFTDVNGMIRYNTTLNTLEYYGNGQWNTTGGTFTVITSRTFASSSGDANGNVDGVNTAFTLPTSSTTNSTIVSINGVLQIPTTAYSVSGTTLTFTEAPSLGDVIDTRVLVTTTTVTSLVSPNSYNVVTAADTGVQFNTGNLLLGSVENWRVDVGGGLLPITSKSLGSPTYRTDTVFTNNVNIIGSTVYGDNGVRYVSPSTTGMVTSFDSSLYRSGKFTVQLSNTGGGEYQSIDAMVIHNGTTPYVTYYGNIRTGAADLATFSANLSGGRVNLNATSAGANLQVKVSSSLMKI